MQSYYVKGNLKKIVTVLDTMESIEKAKMEIYRALYGRYEIGFDFSQIKDGNRAGRIGEYLLYELQARGKARIGV